MKQVFTIPLSEGSQFFDIELTQSVTFSLFWRETQDGGVWVFDLDTGDKATSVHGVPLLVGTDLLEQFEYLELGRLWCELDGQAERPLTYEDVGKNLILYWSENE